MRDVKTGVKPDIQLKDITLTAVCALCAAACLFFFYMSINKTLAGKGESAAFIEIKNNIAQRKFEDRVLWDRLRNKSLLYNGDTIHTENSSDAKIVFTEGAVITLNENTLVQIWRNKGGNPEIDIIRGSVIFDSKLSPKTISAEGGQSRITLESGSAAFIKKNEDENLLDITLGSGGAEEMTGGVVRRVSIDAGAYRARIDAAYNAVHKSRTDDAESKLILAEAREIEGDTVKDIVEAGGYAIPAAPAAPRIITPSIGQTLNENYFTANGAIVFKWAAVKGASFYRLNVFNAVNGVIIRRSPDITGTAWRITNLSTLANGTYRWDLYAVAYDKEAEFESASTPAHGSFKISIGAVQSAKGITAGDVYVD